MQENRKPRAENKRQRTSRERQVPPATGHGSRATPRIHDANEPPSRHGQASTPAVLAAPKPALCCRNCVYACPLQAALGDCPRLGSARPCKACRPAVLVYMNYPDAHG